MVLSAVNLNITRKINLYDKEHLPISKNIEEESQMDLQEKRTRELMGNLSAGCSALAWVTTDGKHLWGRNFDFNRIAQGSQVTYLPKGLPFYSKGTQIENNLDEACRLNVKYAALGMGALVLQSTPTLFEGINEAGLMGGQLYYREFASYPDQVQEGTLPLQPAFAVTYLLTQCKSVDEVVEHLRHKVTLVNAPIFGNVPTVHWMFSDPTGEAVVIEPDKDGLHIYRNSMGVLTNSPSYPWHCQNLLNYGNIRADDMDDLEINGTHLRQCFSGSGGLGLPGDCSSPSRFIRLSLLKKFGVKGRDETEGVAYAFRLFQSVAFPLGMVKVGDTGDLTEHDSNVSEYDYTIYTAVMCAESRRFYWTTYRNPHIRYVDLGKLMELDRPVQIPLESGIGFEDQTAAFR